MKSILRIQFMTETHVSSFNLYSQAERDTGAYGNLCMNSQVQICLIDEKKVLTLLK